MCSPSWSSPNKKSDVRPNDSYFVMIGKAIISSPTGRMALHEIYSYIRKNYPYFKKVNPTGWKNSVRHNLSLHECFIKVGKCEECKGHYWAIHPANMLDFSRGDFHRRRAKAKARLEQSTEKTAQRKEMFWNYQPYSILQWLPMMYNYHNPLLPSLTHPTGVCKGSTNDRSLKFNIINLIDTH